MSFSNDIILKDNNICFYFKYLDWDSCFFNKPSYLLDMDRSNLIVSNVIKKEIKEKLKDSFVTVKIDTSFNYKIVYFLQEFGFLYIDTEVQLEFKNKIILNFNNNVIIERLDINKNLPYNRLGESFNLTRFHVDLNISNKKANQLWIEYLKNYIPGTNKHLFIAKVDNEVAGVILVNVNDNIATLFFVAILKKFRNNGVGKKLINEVINYFDKYVLKVGTQVKNIDAMNFYIKNGFSKVNQTSTVLHYWS